MWGACRVARPAVGVEMVVEGCPAAVPEPRESRMTVVAGSALSGE
jgi:hypothetical protein